MTTPTPATDRETLESIADRIKLAGFQSSADALSAIASRLAPKPEVRPDPTPAEYAKLSSDIRDHLAKPEAAKGEATEPAPDTLERVAEDLEKWNNLGTYPGRPSPDVLVARLRALAANQSDQSDRQLAYAASVPQAEAEGGT